MSINRASRFSLSLAIVAVIAFLALPVRAQEKPPPQSDDVLRTNTDLIQTYVTVLDQKGRFVDGLTREQFQLTIDGQPRPISLFDRVTGGVGHERKGNGAPTSTETANATNAAPTVRPRTIVFFIDDLHLSLDSLERTRKMLRRFVDTELGSRDSVAIVSASGQIGFLQQFTNNKEVLLAAVDRLNHRAVETRTMALGDVPMSEFVALLIDNKGDSRQNSVMKVYVEECQKQSGKNADRRAAEAIRMNCEQLVKSNARMVLTESAMKTANTYVALESLMRSSARMPGRKLAFFISDGFMLDTGHGPDLRGALEQIIDFAQKAGVVVYTIDAKGLKAPGLDATNNIVSDANGRMAGVATAEIAATQDAMHALAIDTGGRALRNQNYFDRWVDQVLDETSNYYVLAWRPSNEVETQKKFRNVSVSVIGNPQFTVRAPRGYFEGSSANTNFVNASAEKPANKKASPDADLQTALADYYPHDSLPTALSLAYVNTPTNGTVLTSSIQITDNSLDVTAGRNPASFLIAGVILNDKGKIANSFKNVVKSSAANETSAIIYNHRTTLSPGIYQVRVAARDEQDKRVGSALQWIVIPDLARNQLNLSSLLLIGAGMQNIRAGNGEAQVQLSVDRRFPRNSQLDWCVFVYNAGHNASGKTDLVAALQVLRDGRTVHVSAPRKLADADTDPQRILFGDRLVLQSLPHGRYDLLITVSDNVTHTTVSRSIDFQIE
jgi:VWFA-related protein